MIEFFFVVIFFDSWKKSDKSDDFKQFCGDSLVHQITLGLSHEFSIKFVNEEAWIIFNWDTLYSLSVAIPIHTSSCGRVKLKLPRIKLMINLGMHTSCTGNDVSCVPLAGCVRIKMPKMVIQPTLGHRLDHTWPHHFTAKPAHHI